MSDITPGKIYEDVFYHPCLCLGIDGGMAWGVSLTDGSHPRQCDLHMSGIRELSIAEAWSVQVHGPTDPEIRASIEKEQR